MPPYLAMPYFHLSKLPLTTKVGLTIFYLSLSAGLVFVGAVYFGHILHMESVSAKRELGSVDAARRHFDPNAQLKEVMEKGGATPEEIAREVDAERDRTLKHTYDIIHPHSFLMPVVFFILIHLMEMTALWPRAKIPLYAGSGACMVVTVFSPLILLQAPGLAGVCFAALYVMLASFLAMALAPLTQMWFAKAP